jgi:hemin uptake protein HemP
MLEDVPRRSGARRTTDRDGAAAAAARPPSVTSRQLMNGARELCIEHCGQTYRLRLTRQNKLILTK